MSNMQPIKRVAKATCTPPNGGNPLVRSAARPTPWLDDAGAFKSGWFTEPVRAWKTAFGPAWVPSIQWGASSLNASRRASHVREMAMQQGREHALGHMAMPGSPLSRCPQMMGVSAAELLARVAVASRHGVKKNQGGAMSP